MKYDTHQRRQLLELLRLHRDEAFSAARLAALMEEQGVSRSAVYRNLAALETEGEVKRVAVGGSRKSCYRYVGAAECRDHLHLSCTRCGAIFHMDHPATDRLIDSVKAGSGFVVDSAATVLVGVCGNCRRGGGA